MALARALCTILLSLTWACALERSKLRKFPFLNSPQVPNASLHPPPINPPSPRRRRRLL